jgi:MFS family permease
MTLCVPPPPRAFAALRCAAAGLLRHLPICRPPRAQETDRLLPGQYVGFVAAAFYLTASLCSYIYGQVVPVIGRRPLFALTAVTHALFFAGVLLLTLDASVLSAVGHATPAAFALVFGLSVTFAVGDSVLESQLPSLVQSPAFLPLERDRACAVSNVRLWMSLGFAFQFGVGIAVPGNIWLQAAILAPVGVLAAVALAVLDRCVRPLSDVAPAGYAAVSVAGEGDAPKET